MKVATILVAGVLLASPATAWAQSADAMAAGKLNRVDTVKIPHASAEGSGRGVSTTDRAIDAELRRIDRMMTICTGC